MHKDLTHRTSPSPSIEFIKAGLRFSLTLVTGALKVYIHNFAQVWNPVLLVELMCRISCVG